MTLLSFVLAIVLLLSILLIYFGKKPFKHRRISQNQVGRFIEELLLYGFDGGYLMFDIPALRAFIQLTKYIDEKGVGIELAFPLAEWSREYYTTLKREFAKMQIDFRIEKTGESTPKVPEFVIVDFFGDVSQATKVVDVILNQVFRVGEGERIDAWFEKVSVGDKKIDKKW